jgi:hypothetical protein
MSAPLTPVEAGRVLWQIGQDIDAETNELIRLRKELPALLRARRLAHARAFLEAEGSIETRKQLAEIATADVKFEVDVLEQKMESCKDKLKALRDRSEIGRAINSNLKEELRVLGGGS